jgi:hypothetical protein
MCHAPFHCTAKRLHVTPNHVYEHLHVVYATVVSHISGKTLTCTAKPGTRTPTCVFCDRSKPYIWHGARTHCFVVHRSLCGATLVVCVRYARGHFPILVSANRLYARTGLQSDALRAQKTDSSRKSGCLS